MRLSQKQKQLVRAVLRPDGQPITAAVGAYSSGKTFPSTLAMLLHSANYSEQNFIVTGHSVGSINRNVTPYLKSLSQGMGLSYREFPSKGQIKIGPNYWHLFGGRTEESQDKVAGMDAAGALVDEATRQVETFFDTTLSRLRVPGAVGLITANPKGRMHWLKRRLDALQLPPERLYHFVLDDNPALPPETKQLYERLYTGATYRQAVLGEWASGEGLIFPEWSETPDNAIYTGLYDVAIDAATSSVTAAVVVAEYYTPDDLNRQRWAVAAEWYYDARLSQPLSVSAQAAHIAGFINGWKANPEHLVSGLGNNPRGVLIDPSASALRLELGYKGVRAVKAPNHVDVGVNAVGAMLAREDLTINSAGFVPNVRRELGEYIWDARAAERGEDKPVKANDHALDAIRYWRLSLPSRNPIDSLDQLYARF